jgi:hypothetical protein
MLIRSLNTSSSVYSLRIPGRSTEKDLKFLKIYEEMKEKLATAAAAAVETTASSTTRLLSGVMKKQQQIK